MQREQNPIWPLYDEIRTARLNKKVLGQDIRLLENRIFGIEILIGVTTSSSIAGLWFFQTLCGAWIWKVLGAVGILAIVLKPILKYQEEKDAKEALLIGYGLFEDQLASISREVQTNQAYDSELKKRFQRVMEDKQDLIRSGVNNRIGKKECADLLGEVEQELPHDHFYMPPI
jgi:hypothetical protein